MWLVVTLRLPLCRAHAWPFGPAAREVWQGPTAEIASPGASITLLSSILTFPREPYPPPLSYAATTPLANVLHRRRHNRRRQNLQDRHLGVFVHRRGFIGAGVLLSGRAAQVLGRRRGAAARSTHGFPTLLFGHATLRHVLLRDLTCWRERTTTRQTVMMNLVAPLSIFEGGFFILRGRSHRN